MTKAEFIERVASDDRIGSKKEATDAVEAVLDSILGALKSGEDVNFTGFGKFSVNERGPRQGVNPRTGEHFVYYETQAGGYGGREGLDGLDGVQPHVQNTENAPIEETEANYPVFYRQYALQPDSEGPGRWRGWPGLGGSLRSGCARWWPGTPRSGSSGSWESPGSTSCC